MMFVFMGYGPLIMYFRVMIKYCPYIHGLDARKNKSSHITFLFKVLNLLLVKYEMIVRIKYEMTFGSRG